MHKADIRHPDKTLHNKLLALYTLNRGAALDLSFRPPFLRLLEKFGNPQDRLPPVIHVAGTNGKGSIIATLRAIMEAGSYKVHTYTSPHLLHFNERIVLAGAQIENEALEFLIDEAITLNDGADITFFEITTAMAFAAYSRTPADVLLLEVGLGGRLDCTNIITKPYVSIINAVSKDHTEFLGSALSEIAREKAGIIKYDTPCVAGYQPAIFSNSETNMVMDRIGDASVDKKAPLYRAGVEWSCEPETSGMAFTFDGKKTLLPQPNLQGTHQIANAGAALAALKILEKDFPLTPSAIATGLQAIHWPGRLERLSAGPLPEIMSQSWELWYDGGHNDSAGAALAAHILTWQKEAPKPLHLVLGMKSDKDPAAFLSGIIPHLQSLSLVPLKDVGGCVKPVQIEPLLKGHDLTFHPESNTIQEACCFLRAHYPEGRILICGSLYLAEMLA